PRYPYALMSLAWTLEYLDQHAEAEATVREAVRIDPKYVDSQHQLAWTLAKGGQYEAAEQVYREELLLRTTFATSHEQFGCVLLERSSQSQDGEAIRRTVHVCLLGSPPVGQPQERQRLAEAFIANKGTNETYGWRERGLVAYRNGDWQQALDACRRSRQLVIQ